MHIRILVFTLMALTLPFALGEPAAAQSAGKGKTLAAFRSEGELADYLRKLSVELRKQRRLERRLNSVSATATAITSAEPAAASITNTQHQGVDEGGIVKLHGKHLVMLRRGRLFTLSIGNGDLKPVSVVDAFGPDIDPDLAWYDELLVTNDKVVVIGYSYARGGTEIGLFNIDSAGRLTYDSTHHIRSNDYYSTRNYASRLIGNQLILYTPLDLTPTDNDLYTGFPALRRWHKNAKVGDFKRIVTAQNIYHLNEPVSGVGSTVLHTVTVCDLGSRPLNCKATGVIGRSGRVFYVSAHAVYVWVIGGRRADAPEEARDKLYRIPFNASGPTAVGVSGAPVDQFSFNETEEGYLNVLVRSRSAGDAMWAAEGAGGNVALLRLPIESFGDGSHIVSRAWYRELPAPAQEGVFQNRLAGDHLLYGTGSGWFKQEAPSSTLFVVHTRYGEVTKVPLPHGVDRIDIMGPDAVVVGSAGEDLHFSGIRLTQRPARVQEFVLQQASQGELRSHGFFYKPEGGNSGVLGLPVRSSAEPGPAHLLQDSASVLFLRNTGERFKQLGKLEAQGNRIVEDDCRASCVDWYGNARPLFIGGRMLALLGYEIVEGELQPGGLRETRRVNFAPRAMVSLTESP